MANGFVNRYSYPRVSVSVQTSVRTSNVLSLPRTNRFLYPRVSETRRVFNERPVNLPNQFTNNNLFQSPSQNRNSEANNTVDNNFSVIDSVNENFISSTQILRANNELSYNNSQLTPEFLKNEFSENRLMRFLVSSNEFIKPSDGDPLSGVSYNYFSLVTPASNIGIKDNTSEFFF